MDIEEIIRQLEESMDLEDWNLVEAVIEKLREESVDNPLDDFDESEVDW